MQCGRGGDTMSSLTSLVSSTSRSKSSSAGAKGSGCGDQSTSVGAGTSAGSVDRSSMAIAIDGIPQLL